MTDINTITLPMTDEDVERIKKAFENTEFKKVKEVKEVKPETEATEGEGAGR